MSSHAQQARLVANSALLRFRLTSESSAHSLAPRLRAESTALGFGTSEFL